MSFKNSSSVKNVEALMDSLLDYLRNKMHFDNDASKRIFTEFFGVPFFELETDKRIKYARVALYEQPETTTDFIQDSRAIESVQTYNIDISVVRAYPKDSQTRGEFPLMELRDAIIEWAKEVDVFKLTNGYLLTFTYAGSDIVERNNRLTNRSLIFTSRRDLLKPQINK